MTTRQRILRRRMGKVVDKIHRLVASGRYGGWLLLTCNAKAEAITPPKYPAIKQVPYEDLALTPEQQRKMDELFMWERHSRERLADKEIT